MSNFSDRMDQHPKHLRELEELYEEQAALMERWEKIMNEMRRQFLEDQGVDTYGGQ